MPSGIEEAAAAIVAAIGELAAAEATYDAITVSNIGEGAIFAGLTADTATDILPDVEILAADDGGQLNQAGPEADVGASGSLPQDSPWMENSVRAYVIEMPAVVLRVDRPTSVADPAEASQSEFDIRDYVNFPSLEDVATTLMATPSLALLPQPEVDIPGLVKDILGVDRPPDAPDLPADEVREETARDEGLLITAGDIVGIGGIGRNIRELSTYFGDPVDGLEPESMAEVERRRVATSIDLIIELGGMLVLRRGKGPKKRRRRGTRWRSSAELSPEVRRKLKRRVQQLHRQLDSIPRSRRTTAIAVIVNPESGEVRTLVSSSESLAGSIRRKLKRGESAAPSWRKPRDSPKDYKHNHAEVRILETVGSLSSQGWQLVEIFPCRNACPTCASARESLRARITDPG